MKIDIDIVNNTVELYINELKSLSECFQNHMDDLKACDEQYNTEYNAFNGSVLGINWGIESLKSIQNILNSFSEDVSENDEN